VYKKGEPTLTMTVHKQGEGSGAIDLIARALFMIPGHIRITALLPRPDGAIVEAEDSESAETVRSVLVTQGWTVSIDQVWARYEFTVPAQLAGHRPDDSGLDPATLVRGLLLRNRHNGLPPESIRHVSHRWIQLPDRSNSGGPSTGEARQRLRIWVDVSPEAEEYLRVHGFLLETLVAAIRLRKAPRSR